MTDIASMLETEIPRLRRYARILTRGDVARADDLVQDSLCRAIQKAHLWQAGTDLRAWLFTILHNVNVNYVRKAAREGQSVPVEDMEQRLSAPPSQPGVTELNALRSAIDKLSEEQRQVLMLIGLEDFSYEDTAAILGVPVGTVRSRLSRARGALRLLMEGVHTRSVTAA